MCELGVRRVGLKRKVLRRGSGNRPSAQIECGARLPSEPRNGDRRALRANLRRPTIGGTGLDPLHETPADCAGQLASGCSLASRPPRCSSAHAKMLSISSPPKRRFFFFFLATSASPCPSVPSMALGAVLLLIRVGVDVASAFPSLRGGSLTSGRDTCSAL